MRFDIISAVPDLLISPLNTSIVKRSQDKGIVEIHVHNLRDYTKDKHRQIDDKPFGGGAGMLLKPEPFFECIEQLYSERDYEHTVLMSPRGKLLEQSETKRLSLAKNILILAGHYKGVDERVSQRFVTEEISIGNYVLSGGELPAAVLIDAVIRLIPGVLNDSESALNDSLIDGNKIEAPFYTRPAEYKGLKVPEILLSGNDKKIEDWKEEQSKIMTERWKNLNTME